MDYASNSRKNKEEKEKPEKKVDRVVTGEVIVQKKSIGRKFKDLFIEADFRSVIGYVIHDVLIPAARNTIVDASTKGIERMMYGESAIRRRNFGPGPRLTTYHTPVNRGLNSAIPARSAPPISVAPRTMRSTREDFILSSREEGELVLERMNDIIDNFDVVSVADLNELVGYPPSHIDNKWGWSDLSGVQIRQVREGYLIDLPPVEPIA